MKINGARLLTAFVILASFLAGSNYPVQAEDCWTVFIPPDTFRTICEGEGGGGEEGVIPPDSCTPGAIEVQTIIVVKEDTCEVWTVWVDACTGEILYSTLEDVLDGEACSALFPAPGPDPSEIFTVTPEGINWEMKWGEEWSLEASVDFPETFLDLGPFPATLVRWPTGARNGGQPTASGTGTLDYIAHGGGQLDDPAVGDWRDARLTLRLIPAASMYFTMPHIGVFALPDVGPTGAPVSFQWELPSHPAAGGTTRAGNVSGLESLPGDIPLFAGSAHSPYRLFWQLTYEEYRKRCEPGADPVTGELNCITQEGEPSNDGHWAYLWVDKSLDGEITPPMVQGLPPALAADVNGDGVPDAFWNNNVTIRRMDQSDRVDNPRWAASWNWDGLVYWAVREGQGQVGWP
jgi:hypothetical protein